MSKNKKPVRWNSYQYDPLKTTEENSGEYLVVPDQSYTIPEIIEKFTRGISLNILRDAQYSDTDDFDEVDERSIIKDYTDIPESVERIKTRQKARSGKGEKTEAVNPEQPKGSDGSSAEVNKP